MLMTALDLPTIPREYGQEHAGFCLGIRKPDSWRSIVRQGAAAIKTIKKSLGFVQASDVGYTARIAGRHGGLKYWRLEGLHLETFA